jgi:putative nucleotidyltransferase with HDIG domain
MASQKEELKKSRRRQLNWIIVVLLVVAITLLSLPTFSYYRTADLEPDRPSPRTYRMDQRYRIVDRERTNRARRQAREKITPRFIVQEDVRRGVLTQVDTQIKNLRTGSENSFEGNRPDNPAGWDRAREVSLMIAESLLDRGLIRDKAVFDRFEDQDEVQLMVHGREGSRTESGLSRRTISTESFRQRLVELDRVEPRARQILRSLFPDYRYDDLVVTVLKDSLRPTTIFDEEHFQRQLNRVEEDVQTYYRTFREGEILLEDGEAVRPEHIQVLRQINQQRLHYQLTAGGASFGIVVMALVFLFFYLREFKPELFGEHNKLALLAVISVLFVGLAKVMELLQFNLPPYIEFAFPLAAPIILVTLMVSEGVAFLFSIFLALIVASYFSLNLQLMVVLILGGFTGIFSIRQVERRTSLLYSGLKVALVQVVMVGILSMLHTGDLFAADLGTRMFWSGVNGAIIVPFTVLGILPFLESGFGITTNFRLLELADLNHPLLRNLFQKAPGSFQHSIMLSNLCEQAARSIGANALLVRVGCLYHDLGKAENPEYFIENQIAREAGLPPEIIDLIEQHHGTTVMKPFYHEALKESEDINREEFQYPGPKPQSREAALCMLGDSVEAGCRALEDPTPQKIKERISTIVQDKFSEGQLNECDLTLQDLNTIIDAFTRILTSVYHQRIEYPEAETPEEMEEHFDELQNQGGGAE